MFCYTLAAKCNHPLFPVVEVQEDILALTLTRWVTVKSIHKHLKKHQNPNKTSLQLVYCRYYLFKHYYKIH